MDSTLGGMSHEPDRPATSIIAGDLLFYITAAGKPAYIHTPSEEVLSTSSRINVTRER